MLTEPEKIKKPHTAITSWSGFIYQGKVALYHVLCLLEKKQEFGLHKLQLDSLDDFSILDADSKIISIHQVKAKKSQYYSSYEGDIIGTKTKAINYNCEQAFFHTARKINDKTPDDIALDEAPVELYQYNDKYHCGVDEIDSQIEEQLKKLWQGQDSKKNDAYAKIARQHLDQIILKQVLAIHGIVHEGTQSDRNAAYTETIEFAKFIELIDHIDLNQIGQDKEYWFYVILNDIHQYYQEYLMNEEVIPECEAEKLAGYMNAIRKLDKEKILNFIRNITPHRKGTINSLKDYKDETFNKDEFHNAFLRILRDLKQTNINEKGLLQWQKEGASYFPTAISSGASSLTNVCAKIVENFYKDDLEIFYERSTFITSDIDVPSIIDAAPKVLSTEGMADAKNDENRILKLKKVALISINKASEEIND